MTGYYRDQLKTKQNNSTGWKTISQVAGRLMPWCCYRDMHLYNMYQ